jgi:hypothetical protein
VSYRNLRNEEAKTRNWVVKASKRREEEGVLIRRFASSYVAVKFGVVQKHPETTLNYFYL